MIIEVNKMKKKLVLKPFVMPVIYLIIVVILLVNMISNIQLVNVSDNGYRYVSKVEFIKDVPVVSAKKVINFPYVGKDVKIVRSFYDPLASEEEQANSLIYYEGTYIQNTGIDYTSNDVYDVVSILDGVVMEISNNELMGTSVEIKHSNDMISLYQSLGSVAVSKGDTVTAGQIIGKSGKSKINSEFENYLHFELIYKGAYVNPVLYFNKSLSDM